MSPTVLVSHSALRIPLPLIVASAGACGAMLTITLLHPTELILEPGRVLVVHDPLGLTSDRLLAHVYREVAHRSTASSESGAPVATTLRWLIARPPLAQVWDAVDALGRRSWRLAPGRSEAGARSGRSSRTAAIPHHEGGRTTRVAESGPRPAPAPPDAAPAVLLLSEADRPDALSPQSAARLLARAIRRDWAVLAATREGPLTARHNSPGGRDELTARGDDERRLTSGRPDDDRLRATDRARSGILTVRDWCTHVVCQGGGLRPVASR